jgi:predicted  nucleic acid-binding Zn-ribbon protein
MSSSLAAAKRRRAPGQPLSGSAPVITQPVNTQNAPSGPLTLQQAINLVGVRINKLEQSVNTNLKEVETKFGQQDNYIVENLPDIDAINTAFEDINQRLLNIETQGVGEKSNLVNTIKTENNNNELLEASLAELKSKYEDQLNFINILESRTKEKLDYFEEALMSLDNTNRVVSLEQLIQQLSQEMAQVKDNITNNGNQLQTNIDELQTKLIDFNNEVNEMKLTVNAEKLNSEPINLEINEPTSHHEPDDHDGDDEGDNEGDNDSDHGDDDEQ